MKLPSLPSLGLQLPLEEDDLSLEDDDLLAEEAEAPASPALQEAAGLPPAEHPSKGACAAATPAPATSNSAAPKPETLAAQVSSCLPIFMSLQPLESSVSLSNFPQALRSQRHCILESASSPLPAIQRGDVRTSGQRPKTAS